MGTLAHVLEAEGLSTVALAQVRGQVDRVHPPRALYAEFPLGRPLGRPRDPEFQRGVLDAAFALLEQPSGPVLVDFPKRIEDAADEPLACPLPPRVDPDEHEAVDEARALRSAYDRAVTEAGGRTAVGRSVGADEIPDAVVSFVRIESGTPLREAGLPANPIEVVMDIRAFYEEAALALADHIPEARSAETWFYRTTAAGRAILAAREQLKQSGAPFPVWFYMAPATYQ